MTPFRGHIPKKITLSHSSHQNPKPLCKILLWGSSFLFHAGLFTGSLSWDFSACSPSHCDVMCTKVLPCPPNILSLLIFTTPGSYNLPFLFCNVPELCPVWRCDTSVHLELNISQSLICAWWSVVVALLIIIYCKKKFFWFILKYTLIIGIKIWT